MIRKPHQFKKISRRRAQKTQTKLLIILAGAFILFLFIFWFLAYSNYFKISKIIISGNKKVQVQEINDFANNYLNKKSFIPSNNIIFLNKKGFLKDLNDKFFIIQTTQLKRVLPNQLQIIIKERLEYAIWCQDTQAQEQNNESDNIIIKEQCFFVDQDAMLFQETDKNDFSVQSHLSGKKIGEQVINNNLLNLIVDVKNQCESKIQIELENAKIISENQINFKTKQGWEIYINPKKTIDTQITALKSILDLKIPQEKRSKLEYIDLRFETVSIYPNLLKNSE